MTEFDSLDLVWTAVLVGFGLHFGWSAFDHLVTAVTGFDRGFMRGFVRSYRDRISRK